MSKIWRDYPGECCANCGDEIEVYTDELSKDGYVYDCDPVRCTNCHQEGSVSVYEEGEVSISFYDEMMEHGYVLKKIQILEAKNKVLMEAVKFYADEELYDWNNFIDQQVRASIEGGIEARKAIKRCWEIDN